MSDENKLTCPICRARQKLQPKCRRCKADLSLFVKALNSTRAARQLCLVACRAGNQVRTEQAWRYLQWLKPRDAVQLSQELSSSEHPSDGCPGDRPSG